MKTTIKLPDQLLITAKKKAAEMHWVTVKGSLPPGLNIADRVAMHDWIRTKYDGETL